LGVFFYIFVVLSRYLFQPMPPGEKNAYKFSSFSLSFCTLFQLLTLDQWFDIETVRPPPRRDQERFNRSAHTQITHCKRCRIQAYSRRQAHGVPSSCLPVDFNQISSAVLVGSQSYQVSGGAHPVVCLSFFIVWVWIGSVAKVLTPSTGVDPSRPMVDTASSR
jgi:hypothetical protein